MVIKRIDSPNELKLFNYCFVVYLKKSAELYVHLN